MDFDCGLGPHVIEIDGEQPSAGLIQDITYNLEVIAVPKH